jgi:two-component system response regulator AtoC
MVTECPVLQETTILAADDDPSVRTFLETALRAEGRRVLTVSDGQQAVATVSSQKVDVVLLDLMMPGLSGLEALERLLQADAALVVIVLTGYGAVNTAREAMRLGAYDYVTKPFDISFLEEVITDSLSLRQEIALGGEQ